MMRKRLKTISLDQMIDEHIGKADAIERINFENKVKSGLLDQALKKAVREVNLAEKQSTQLAKEKEFDAVKTFRAIKEKISLEMADMDFEQIKQYLKNSSEQFQEQSKNT